VQIADVPADQLTHLIYAFARIDPSGQLALFDSYAATEKRFTEAGDAVGGEADQWYYAPEDLRSSQTIWGNFNQIAALKELHPHLRTSIAIGGWTLSGNFSTTLDTAAERELFADSVVSFLRTYTMFDGVDFDWEYPGGGGLESNAVSPADGANYGAALQLVRQKLDALEVETGRTYEISVAAPAGSDKIVNLNLPELKEVVDFFNVMTYDFHGTWESATGHQAALQGDAIGYDIRTALDLYLQAGVDPARIVLGLPAYSRAWSGVQSRPETDGVEDYGYGDAAGGAAPGTYEAGVYDYKDLLAQYRAGGWQLVWDDNAQAAYLWHPQQQIFSSFETPATVALKSAWAREQGLGGVMFWDLSNDATGDSESLVEAAAAFWLEGRSFAEIAAASGLRFDAIVGGDGRFDLDGVLRDPGSTGVVPPPVWPKPLPLPQPLPQPEPVAPDPTAPDPTAPDPAMPVDSAQPIAVALQLSSQWSGAFEGTLLLTNQGGEALSTWSVSFTSRYELRGLSDFTLQQSRNGDGTWLVTLSPPSWGTTLQPGSTSRSYVQGLIPAGGQLPSLDASQVLVGGAPIAAPQPVLQPEPLVPDPIIGAPLAPAALVDVPVAPATSRLQARGDLAEQFRLGYAWGRELTIEGFDPSLDVLDLRGFWGEGQQARVLGVADGTRIALDFNQQSVLLPGVTVEQVLPGVVQIWQG
jgi:GH18 family chitinase